MAMTRLMALLRGLAGGAFLAEWGRRVKRLAAIERAVDTGATAVMALRRTAAAPASRLEPPGGLPALTEAYAPYADISMPVRRGMIDAGARLRASDAFARLSTAEATALRRPMRRRCFGPGEAVVRRGDPGDALCVIEAGEADALVTDDPDQTRTARRMGRGDHFGEIALLGGGARTCRTSRPRRRSRCSSCRDDDEERYLAEIGS
jgi:cyclic nucleotide-binding protein